MASIQLRHFMIHAAGNGEAEEELNRFLRGHQVLEVRQEFVQGGTNSTWCVAVRYAGQTDEASQRPGKRARVDYRDVLEPEEFARFVELRKRRKAIAEHDAIPPFAVFTDEELAGIARLPSPTVEEMRAVKGIGEKKAARFGERILGRAPEDAP